VIDWSLNEWYVVSPRKGLSLIEIDCLITVFTCFVDCRTFKKWLSQQVRFKMQQFDELTAADENVIS
jgi:hypothetical protein